MAAIALKPIGAARVVHLPPRAGNAELIDMIARHAAMTELESELLIKEDAKRHNVALGFLRKQIARARRATEREADKAAHAATQAAGGLTFDPDAPLPTARRFLELHHTRDDKRTLHHQNDAFWQWRDTHYVEVLDENTLSDLYSSSNPRRKS